MTLWSMGGQVSCQHVLFGCGGEGWSGGVGMTVAVSGDLIIWWTQQWRDRIHTGLSLSLSVSRVACLIRPLLMESSGGTYRKYWSYFDRVFSPLHNQQCITATPLILCTQAHATTTSLDAIAEGGVTLISIPKQAKPVFACVKMFA